MNGDPPLKKERYAAAIVLLVILAGLKLGFTPGLGHRSLDGNYYFQVARHVASGDGLETSVSLYHQGLEELPHPTNVVPIWPLVLGWSGRLLGVEAASHLVPKLLYLVALVLALRLGVGLEREWPRSAGEPTSPRLGLGPIAVLVLGLNPIFFRFTSLPYTEALAFVSLFAALLATGRAVATNGIAWGALAGALGMATFMTRVQFVGVPWVVVGVLVWAAVADRRRWRPALAAALAAALVLLPWVLYLRSWARPFGFGILLGVGNYRETPELLPYAMRVVSSSWSEALLDRLSGLATAFDPSDEDSYVRSFGGVAFLVPLGLLLAAFDRRWRSLGRWRSLPLERPLTLASVSIAVLALAPLHVWHYRYFKEWLFGFRHGLPFLLLVLAAVAFLWSLGRRTLDRVVAALVLTTVLVSSLGVATVLGTDYQSGLTPAEAELVQWLDRGGAEAPVAVTTRAQTLTAFSRAGFHWMQCDEASSQTLALLEQTSAGYVIAYPGETRCPFLRDLVADMEVVGMFGEPPLVLQLLRLRGSG